MIFKKKFVLLTLFLIIIFQTLLYTNNNQKTSFRYLNWTFQEVSLGKLISISFLSGLFIGTLFNTTVRNLKKNNLENNIEQNNETIDNYENIKSNMEMPPQRDIRDAQPTISVNYRVVKNNEENNFRNDQNYSNSFDNKDDWDNVNNDW